MNQSIHNDSTKPDFSSHEKKERREAFSLIEVVLAIGVVAFALLGIFGLFTSSLRTNKDASAQQEGFEVQRMLISKLQDTNQFPTNVLSNMFKTNYTFATPRTNTFFVYTTNSSTSPPVTILTNSVPASFSTTNGTLYYVMILPTTNISTNIFPKANPSYQTTDWTNWPSLPVHATVYAIPTPTSTNATFISNSTPVISFDFIIPK